MKRQPLTPAATQRVVCAVVIPVVALLWIAAVATTFAPCPDPFGPERRVEWPAR